MFIVTHPHSDSLTMIRYDGSGVVSISVTDPTPNAEPFGQTMSLAQFLREIGIPFKAVRAITSGERVDDPAVA